MDQGCSQTPSGNQHTNVKTKPIVLLCEDQAELITKFENDFKDVFEIHVCNCSSKVSTTIDELKNKNQFPDAILMDLYWPRGHITPKIAHDSVNREVDEFYSQIDKLRREVNSNLFPDGIEHLREIRSQFSPYALPVLMYTRAGPYILEPTQIEQIYDLGSSILIKGYNPVLTAHLVNKHIERWRLPYDVFVSYSEKDAMLANELFVKLSQKELTVFLAQESIDAGEEWVLSIRRALRLSKVFVCAASHR